ncbi:MAG: hypothetical protein ACK4S2_07015 [Gemmobacter sp.]|uniref:hypothetical protein n=1 Tax=Gemmobacter sp. TaxID=1898957 RepID=UPI00391DE2CB
MKPVTRKGRNRRPRPVSLPATPTSWDKGADGPANQDRLIDEPAAEFDPRTGRETPNPNGVRRRRRLPWVRVYHVQGRLSAQQLAAAERLRMAAEGMRERDPLAALRIDRTGHADPEAARVDARAWFRRLWAAVPPASRAVVERVAIDDQPIWHGNTAQRERYMQRLREGLDAIP